MKILFKLLGLLSFVLLIVIYFVANNFFSIFELINLVFMSISIYLIVIKFIPKNTKLPNHIASIISIIITTLITYNIWPILYNIKYGIHPENYSFYFPFLTNITAFAENFYSMKISITLGIPDLLPISIKNAILNIINIVLSITLIFVIPIMFNTKTVNTNRNYMKEK